MCVLCFPAKTLVRSSISLLAILIVHMMITIFGKGERHDLNMCCRYGQVYLEPFWINPLVEQEERRLRRMAIKCFNCGEDHHIKDCPLVYTNTTSYVFHFHHVL